MQYTTSQGHSLRVSGLFYQDFKDTFVCNTQPSCVWILFGVNCFIKISKILLYAIHNIRHDDVPSALVVLSGFQRYFCMQYTTLHHLLADVVRCLSGFQRYFCMQYTTTHASHPRRGQLFYQDFKDTFVCYTQLYFSSHTVSACCFIWISKIHFYAIHNTALADGMEREVVLSGFQRYFCMQYTTMDSMCFILLWLFYQDFNEQFCCKSTEKIGNMQIYEKYFVI